MTITDSAVRADVRADGPIGLPRPSPTAIEHLPNPFEYLSDEQLDRAVADVHQRALLTSSPKAGSAEDRRAAAALLQAATASASSILAAAIARSDSMLAEASAKRAEASTLLHLSTRGAEELLNEAAAKAELIRQQAERVRQYSDQSVRDLQIDLREPPPRLVTRPHLAN